MTNKGNKKKSSIIEILTIPKLQYFKKMKDI